MTQPTEAVGGAGDASVAGEPSLEDRFAAQAGEAEEREPGEREAEAPEGAEAELNADEVAGEEAAPDERGPPIKPPISWTAAEKEEFGKLPRTLQETLTRRESERERFVQSKAQEAAQTRSLVEREALVGVQRVQAEAAARLQHFESLLAVPEPDPMLIAEDPDLYAAQLQQHRYYTAQREQAQRNAQAAMAQAAQAEREIKGHELRETQALLADKFPEYLDPEKGVELRRQLGSTALELGYSAEQLAHVDGNDILAMRTATEWRDKAAKYDRLMAQKMERVRDAKDMPRVSRPGAASAPGSAAHQAYAADRQKMKQGDKDASIRVFSRFV